MRSMLFVPGDRPDRFAKAAASGADAVILDLEDAVVPERRPYARAEIAHWLSSAERRVPAWVRINPVGTDDALPDLAAVIEGRPDGIVLPKARDGADVHRVVGGQRVRGATVGVGVDGDALEAGLAAGPGDADRDLAAVGDEHALHRRHMRNTP